MDNQLSDSACRSASRRGSVHVVHRGQEHCRRQVLILGSNEETGRLGVIWKPKVVVKTRGTSGPESLERDYYGADLLSVRRAAWPPGCANMQLSPSAGRAPTDGGCLCVSPATGAHHFPRGLLEDGGAAAKWSGAKRLAVRSGRLLQCSNWPLCANYPRTGCRCAAVLSRVGEESGGARML
jgi:hypothetical protein